MEISNPVFVGLIALIYPKLHLQRELNIKVISAILLCVYTKVCYEF